MGERQKRVNRLLSQRLRHPPLQRAGVDGGEREEDV